MRAVPAKCFRVPSFRYDSRGKDIAGRSGRKGLAPARAAMVSCDRLGFHIADMTYSAIRHD